MFGYVRPYKPNLLVQEFTQYRAFYCGICQAISDTYGQIPRAGVTYDLTFMAALLESLAVEEPEHKEARCVSSPFNARTMTVPDVWLDYCAALTCLLGREKARDDVADGDKVVRGRVTGAMLGRSARIAASRHPEAQRIVAAGLQACSEAEASDEPAVNTRAPLLFGQMLGELLALGFSLGQTVLSKGEIEAAAEAGVLLGQWIYLIDALEDYDEDLASGAANAVHNLQTEDSNFKLASQVLNQEPRIAEILHIEARALADGSGMLILPLSQRQQQRLLAAARMTELEYKLSQILAMLPYQRCGGIVANIVEQGLPQTKMAVLAGEHLPRL